MSFGNRSNYPRKHQFNITQLDEMFTEAYPTIMLRGEQVMRLNYFIEHFCATGLSANDICKQTISRLKYAINHYNDITLYEIAHKDTNSSYLDSVWRTYKSNVVGSFTSFEEFVIWVQLNCQK